MNSPDEIKKGLEYLSITNVAQKVEAAKKGLPYAYTEEVAADALALIQQLQAENADQAVRIQQLEKRVIHLEALNQSDLTTITMQERTRARFQERISQLEAERDALLKYITDATWAACDICKHGIDGASVLDCKHIREVGVPCFEWRGLLKEE